MSDEIQFVSITEAAKRLGVGDRTIRRAVKDGRLTEYRMGYKILRVDLAEVLALMKTPGA